MRQQYRLPTIPRTITEDSLEWANAWNELGDKVVKYFPGYRVGGMDPGIMLFGTNDTVQLSLQACLALLSVK